MGFDFCLIHIDLVMSSTLRLLPDDTLLMSKDHVSEYSHKLYSDMHRLLTNIGWRLC